MCVSRCASRWRPCQGHVAQVDVSPVFRAVLSLMTPCGWRMCRRVCIGPPLSPFVADARRVLLDALVVATQGFCAGQLASVCSFGRLLLDGCPEPKTGTCLTHPPHGWTTYSLFSLPAASLSCPLLWLCVCSPLFCRSAQAAIVHLCPHLSVACAVLACVIPGWAVLFFVVAAGRCMLRVVCRQGPVALHGGGCGHGRRCRRVLVGQSRGVV
jgi:hypothetical protein